MGIFLNDSSEIYIDLILKSFVKDEIHIKLYFASGYSQRQLLPIISHVYKGNKDIIQPHLILICGPDTTEKRLDQFFKRAKGVISTYMIVGVNNLSSKLQEVITIMYS